MNKLIKNKKKESLVKRKGKVGSEGRLRERELYKEPE